MKKLLGLFVVLIFIATACEANEMNESTENETEITVNGTLDREEIEQLEVVATLFVHYDFATQIGGERVNVSLLVPFGTEVSTYEPTAEDMSLINEADLFIYTGAEIEPWVDRLNSDAVMLLDVSEGIELLAWEGNHGYDPYIWTSPINAIQMVENIRAELINLSPDGGEYFSENANALISELLEIDQGFRELTGNTQRTTIYHAGHFTMYYLKGEYDIDFVAIPLGSEPDSDVVASMMTEIRRNSVPVIFHEELADLEIVELIADETNATPRILHTIQHVSADDIASGTTYVRLMRQNLAHIKTALGWTPPRDPLAGAAIAEIDGDHQFIQTTMHQRAYEKIAVEVGIPVVWNIYVPDEATLHDCNNPIQSTDFDFEKTLEVGDNIIEFIPTEVGTFTYNCWMGMMTGFIIVQ